MIEQKGKVILEEISSFIESKYCCEKVVILFFKKLTRKEDM
jgi:hypothetical protein